MDAPLDRWLAAAGRFILPPRCLACGDRGVGSTELCAGCLAALPWNDRHCARCALPLPRETTLCGSCQRATPSWHAAWVPFRYAAPIDQLEARFKFHGQLAAGRTLAHCWLRARCPLDRPDAVVPVPLHVSRLRRRGFNQALELVKPLARRIGCPLWPDALERVRMTAAQSDLDAAARARNVRGAFAVRRLPAVRHVAVVDDVMTTGATLEACARALRDAGVARVDIWALARTGRDVSSR
ncbi:ComF family protein [Luteibacter sp. PPL201]|uniref:ComF family protein n=1 Tax=Luteibacter sahnii TaxID=3021977 RepID=A0ABT6BDU4_9GAMM